MEMYISSNVLLFVSTISIFQQLRTFLNDFVNSVRVCKSIEPRNGSTRTTDFFSNIRVVSLIMCMLSTILLKHLSLRF